MRDDRERRAELEAENERLRVAGREAFEWLQWALDLLDMYDERMVQLGDPRELVYSKVHVEGKAGARTALGHATLKQAAARYAAALEVAEAADAMSLDFPSTTAAEEERLRAALASYRTARDSTQGETNG